MRRVAFTAKVLAIAGVAFGSVAGCSGATPAGSSTRRAEASPIIVAAASEHPNASAAPVGTFPWTTYWVPVAPPGGVQVSDDATPTSDPMSPNLTMSTSDSLFAWGSGYVVFRETVEFGADVNDDTDEISITPWISSDGSSWQKGPPMDVSGLYDDDRMGAVVEGRAGLVAVAYGTRSDDENEFADAVTGMWTSADGKSWKRLDISRTFGVDAIGDVAAGPLGYIASNFSSMPAGGAPAVWLSADGRKWRSVALSKGSLAEAHLGSVYVLPAGYLLAGWKGVPIGDEGDTTPAIWSSTDGVTWKEANLPDVVAASRKQAFVEHAATGLYVALVGTWACGCEPRPDYQAWTSIDGFSWQAAGASWDSVDTSARGPAGPMVENPDGSFELWKVP
jgi:hypothetical protein